MELRPERGWENRATIIPSYPPRVYRLYKEVEALHGRAVASLVLHAYRFYGERVALLLASRLLRTRPDELLSSLVEFAFTLPRTDADPVIEFIARVYSERIIDAAGEGVCDEARARARILAARLLRAGFMIPARCVAEYVASRYCSGRGVSKRCGKYVSVIAGVDG